MRTLPLMRPAGVLHVRGAKWSPVYDARLDTGKNGRKPALDLVRRAEIVQTTGEDWADVQLAVSTARTAKGGNAPELRPLIVHYPAPRPQVSSRMQEFSRGPVLASAYGEAGDRTELKQERSPPRAGSRGRHPGLPGGLPHPRPRQRHRQRRA